MKRACLIFLAFVSLHMVEASGDPDKVKASATIAINHIKSFSVESVTVEPFAFGGDVEYDIKGSFKANGQVTTFTLTVPSLEESSYNKYTNGTLAGISLDYGSMYLSSDGPFIPDVEDLGDYMIEIDMVTSNVIKGSFVANLQDGISTETLQVSGDFVIQHDAWNN